jgi:ribosome recycling factor
MPPLTEERRKELVKVVRQETENTRIAIRNIRRDVNSDLKSLRKDKAITEDEAHAGEKAVQKITDESVAAVDLLLERKEQALMEA